MNFQDLSAHADARWRRQTETNPAAQTLAFWEEHFTTRCARLLTGCSFVLDVGGSFGAVGHYVRKDGKVNAAWCVLEPSAAAIEHGRSQTIGVHFFHGAMPEFAPGLTRIFDAAFLGQVLEHVEDPHAVLASVRRVLVPYAPVVVVVPHGANHDDPDHKRRFTQSSLGALLLAHGEGVRTWLSRDGTQIAGTMMAHPEEVR